MKILTITSLYPNNRDPKHGVFVETRLRHLIAHYPDVQVTVIAPVPWFPLRWKIFGEYARFAGVQNQEERYGIRIYHPRYLVLPKIGMLFTPFFMKKAIQRCMQRLSAAGAEFDVIDGHYFFPDGVAISQIAEQFDLPFTCTARGTDINLIPRDAKPKKLIQQVFAKASHLMAVCKALADEMITLGADAKKVTVLRNGVDLNLFSFADEQAKQELRQKQNIAADKKIIASVGWLIERKGHHFVIEALLQLPNVQLMIAGDGPDLKQLQELAKKCGVLEQVTFLGALSQEELKEIYQISDILVLASSREGWANVLLEAMASGTPVVATNIWGTPEVVSCPEAGLLCERSVQDIAAKISQLLAHPPKRIATRKYAEQFTWQQTSDGQYNIFKSITKGT